jgi:hypothetical protein
MMGSERRDGRDVEAESGSGVPVPGVESAVDGGVYEWLAERARADGWRPEARGPQLGGAVAMTDLAETLREGPLVFAVGAPGARRRRPRLGGRCERRIPPRDALTQRRPRPSNGFSGQPRPPSPGRCGPAGAPPPPCGPRRRRCGASAAAAAPILVPVRSGLGTGDL